MNNKLETNFGYVNRERASVGAYANPFSFFEALQHAQDAGSRIITSAEYNKAIEFAESRREKALQNRNIKELREAEKLLLDFYGIKLEGIGYAGARDLTATVMDFKEGSIKEADGISLGTQNYIYGQNYYYRWISQLEKKTRELQSRGLTPFIQEFDPNIGLPVQVGDEPKPEYHGAVFWISPNVKETGVVTRGQHHAVGELCSKYDVMILPTDYKDIMLGHRTVSDTNESKLVAVTGIAGALIYELADKTIRARISPKEAAKKISEYIFSKKMSRRASNSAIALFSLYLAGCDGGSSNGTSPPPPPPPPPKKFEYSGSVSERIDGFKIDQGEVVLEGTPGTFKADVDSAGNFRITSIPSGTYRRTTRDKSGDSVFVQQIESVVPINSNLAGQNYSIIERGNNRFDVQFDSNFQTFYNKLAQRSGFGIFKWGNTAGQEPQRIRIATSTIPDDVESLFINAVNFVNYRDTPTFSGERLVSSGERLVSLPTEFGEVAADYEIEMSMGPPAAAGTTYITYPLTDGRRLIRARALFDSIMADHLRQGIDRTHSISHEYGHCYGAADFEDDNFRSIMNGKLGMTSNEPSVNDMLAFYLFNHQHVRPGNTPPDTNP